MTGKKHTEKQEDPKKAADNKSTTPIGLVVVWLLGMNERGMNYRMGKTFVMWTLVYKHDTLW